MVMPLVICVRNKGHAASLEKRKVYVAIPDSAAAKHGHTRVIDESGEDYVVSREFFHTCYPAPICSQGHIGRGLNTRQAVQAVKIQYFQLDKVGVNEMNPNDG
jgi:hypothetical protein